MERVKPLDYNDDDNENNIKVFKINNCNECCYCPSCSLCARAANNEHRNKEFQRHYTKTLNKNKQSGIQVPRKKSISISYSNHANHDASFNEEIKRTASTSVAGDKMSVLIDDDVRVSTKRSNNNVKSKNRTVDKGKTISFFVPTTTTTDNRKITTTKSIVVHEYENIPPSKPKRKYLSKAFNSIAASGVQLNNKKKSIKNKKYNKFIKIPDTYSTAAAAVPRHNPDHLHDACNGVVKKTNRRHFINNDANEPIINNKNFKQNEYSTKLRLSQGCTSLMYACLEGNTGIAVQELRTKPEKVHRRDRKNKNVLHYCSSCKKNTDLVAAASVAVKAPELLESADEDGFTPLHLAVIQGNLAMVNLLLANKADVNAVDNEGHSVVHWATVCGEIEALRAVLQAGASVTKPDINGGSTLHYAAQMCGAHYEGKLNQATSSKLALEILTILLNHPQSSVDLTDKDGRQPLLWAASAGSAKAVIALVKAGARVESSDKDGLTALHCAASRGHTECIDTLISLCGAPTDLIDSNGCTALHYAVTLGHADATSRLLDLEADPNRQDRKGRTPAHCGCAKGQLETVKLLKERGANLWLRNAKGDLPLHEAASSGRRELVEWLLDQRPKQVNTTSNDGRTMLHIAANNDFTDMCKMLIDFSADINCIYRNSKGVAMTPLDCALAKGYRSTAKFLQSNNGLPASKLRLSGRRPNAFNDQELVKPLKYAEKEEVHDLQNKKKYVIYSKRSDSESSGCSCSEHWYKKEHHVNHLCKHHRKRLRRRTNSCGEMDEIENHDSCSDICRSKSNIEIRRKRSRERVYSSDEGDSCQVCCRHKRKLKTKRKERCSQRRYKEIMYSEEEDDAQRMRNQRRVEKEKGRYSNKEGSKTNSQGEYKGAKDNQEQDNIDGTSMNEDKSQQPQSAKKRKQTSKEDTFIKSPENVELLSNTGPLDITDDDEIQKSEIVVTQVEVHKQDEQSTTSLQSAVVEKAPPNIEEAPAEITVNDISKEVNEVIDDAKETVEKITEDAIEKEETTAPQEPEAVSQKPEETAMSQEAEETVVSETVEQQSAEVKESEQENSETQAPESEKAEKKETKEEVAETEKENVTHVVDESPETENDLQKEEENITEEASEINSEKEEEIKDSQPKESDEKKEEVDVSQQSITPTATLVEELEEDQTKTEEFENAKDQKESDKTQQTDNLNQPTIEDPKEEKIERTVQETEQIENQKPTSSSKVDDDKKLTFNEKEKYPDKTVQIMEQVETSDTLPSQITPLKRMSLKTPVEREQESRRSFTLLPDSPVAVSEIDHLQHEHNVDESSVRKSSFQVLKSDESIENYDVQNDESNDNAETSFQVVSSPEKPTTSNRVTYSSEEAAEIDDEEDEEQNDMRTGVPGTIYVSRDGRHSALAGSVSDLGSGRRKRLKRRVKSGGKARGWRSVEADEADEESPSGQQARDQDSGFEPSPRATTKTKLKTSYNSYGSYVPKKTFYTTIDGRTCSSRTENRKPGDKNGCNMTAVTKSIHRNIRRYYMERKIFQHLLELKSLQIRSSKLNEAVLVKRTVDDYHKSCIALGAETGAGSLRRYPYTEYTFKNFEMFLYETLKSLQKPGTFNFQNINEVYEEAERRLSPDYNTYEKALQCTTKTHRCLHAAHAYTGIPCAAYIPMMNHHTMPKTGFNQYKKPTTVGSFYLPKILSSPVKSNVSNKQSGGGGGTKVSLELSHGKTKQLISLPSDKLDSNKRYYVTFTVKGSGEGIVTGSPGKTKIELSSDGKFVQQTDVTPIEK